MECVFCKIIDGKEPREAVFENETVIAIKPRTGVNPGHTLVIPKQHFKTIFDIPKEAPATIAEASQDIAKNLTKQYGSVGINLLHASGTRMPGNRFLISTFI